MAPEVYLPDDRVIPVQEKLVREYPILIESGTEFVSVRHEPPFTGQLPTGEVGSTDRAVVQFLVVSPHPRRWLYGNPGTKLTSTGTVWETDWEEAEQEYRNGHYVHTDKRDPLEVIYAGLCAKHVADLVSLKQIIN